MSVDATVVEQSADAGAKLAALLELVLPRASEQLAEGAAGE